MQKMKTILELLHTRTDRFCISIKYLVLGQVLYYLKVHLIIATVEFHAIFSQKASYTSKIFNKQTRLNSLIC